MHIFASSIPRFKRGLKFRSPLGTEVPDESADAAPAEHVAAEPVTPEPETQMAVEECEDSPLGHFFQSHWKTLGPMQVRFTGQVHLPIISNPANGKPASHRNGKPGRPMPSRWIRWKLRSPWKQSHRQKLQHQSHRHMLHVLHRSTDSVYSMHAELEPELSNCIK